MAAWYRNTDWNDGIAADFEKRLARSGHQKAQNLSLQGYALIGAHPAVARDLLTRAVAVDDAYETPRAMSFLALAELSLGEVDNALSVFEAALERQMAQPNIIAVQPVDYIFLVGIFMRAERLAAAEPIADALPDEGLFGPDPQILAAKALVYQLAGRGDDARRYADLARPLMADMPDLAALGISISALKTRLDRIVASAP